MSKIVVSSMVSIDGYTEGRGGDVMSMPMGDAFAEHIIASRYADGIPTASSMSCT